MKAVVPFAAIVLSVAAGTGDGIYRIQQKGSNGGQLLMRYLDAFEKPGSKVVTRGFQQNPSQWWKVTSVGLGVYTIQQLGTNTGASDGLYLDAYEGDAGGVAHSFRDGQAVVNPAQNNPSQQWVITPSYDGSFRIQQAGGNNGKYVDGKMYLDAYDRGQDDWGVVMRPFQQNPSQEWVFTSLTPDEAMMAEQWLHQGNITTGEFWPFAVLGIMAGVGVLGLVVATKRRSASANAYVLLV